MVWYYHHPLINNFIILGGGLVQPPLRGGSYYMYINHVWWLVFLWKAQVILKWVLPSLMNLIYHKVFIPLLRLLHRHQIGLPKKKRSSSNHPVSGATSMLVSGRANMNINQKTTLFSVLPIPGSLKHDPWVTLVQATRQTLQILDLEGNFGGWFGWSDLPGGWMWE